MERGFSRDGYIIDQDCFKAYPYRGTTSDINGCGWIAAYNFLRALGAEVEYRTVNREMNAMFPLQIPGPTPMRVLRRYLRRYVSFRFVPGRAAALNAAKSSEAGILRYWEEKVPHFIAFVRTGEVYRFFNVADGQEEVSLSMEAFFGAHCHRGWVRILVEK